MVNTSLTAIATITTGVITSSSSIPATLVDPAVTQVKVMWDITGNTSASNVSSQVRLDVSQDNGVNWTTLCTAGRNKGYDLGGGPDPNNASIVHPLPGVGNPQRMIRVFLILSAAMTTTLTAILS